jgi:subtilisin-like proprotein convertase family protein
MKQFSSNLHTENNHFKKQFLKLSLLLFFIAHTGIKTNAQNPTVSINQSAAQSDPTSLQPINFTVVFDQPVTGFTTGDVVITGTASGTLLSVVTGGPTLYFVAVSGMTSCGTVIVNIPAGVCTNTLTQPNLASTSIDNTVTYLPSLPNPNVTINQAATQPDPTSASPINFTVVFDQVVTGFTTGDVTLSGTAGATTGIVTGSGTTYNVAVSGTTAAGTVIATIAGGVCQSACTQPNNASTSTDNTVTINCVPPVVNVTPAVSCGPAPNGSGPCNPLTASGNADIYIWTPFAGLYNNCTLTVPYSGANLSTVYAAPTNNTTYTVTGTITATGCVKTATALVNYTPPAPVITPSPVNMCLSDPAVKLRVVSGNGVNQFCSGTANIAVPDNNPAGAFSTINVSGISVNCIISGMTVTVNMPHSNIGDMVFALKAPNGMVINLDYFISATGGNGPSSGFTNTVFSSTGTVPLSAGTNPYTGTFRADVINNGPFGPSGPTGMLPTANNWSSLYPTAPSVNGTWTLGFYDGQTGNTGFLTSWCLTFNTSCTTVPASPAVWTPSAGLFTDAAALIPYVPGTAVDSVWVRPIPAGVYTYQVTTSGTPPGVPVCTSMPRSVVVTVGQPPVVTSQPVNVTVCSGTSAAFSATVAGTGPFTYQWQVSSGGATGPYVNCANGGGYIGTTTATLVINPLGAGMNGQYYMLRIIGACGSVSTIPALLTVNALPTVSITANPLTIPIGQTTTIRSMVTQGPVTYAWYYNGGVLPGATADTLLVQYGSPGDYQLKLTNACGVGASNIITIANSFAINMFTYPNPSGGIFQLRYTSPVNTTVQRTLVIYNNQGNKIISKNFTQTIPYQKVDIDVRAHGKGIYWVELKDGYGRRLAMNRVVVQ